MKKRKIPLLPVLGICLILASVLLVLIFQTRMHRGAQHSQKILSRMEQLLPERTPGVPGIYPASGMPVLELENVDYVAMLEVPAFGVALPVTDHWDSSELSHSPSRFFGSAYDNTLIIGGADDPRQFGFCDKIELGAQITVTDMTGAQFTYTVSGADRAKHAEPQWLMDAECDLTLFCRDIYSMEYIAVRCVFCSESSRSACP
jgi:sortase A